MPPRLILTLVLAGLMAACSRGETQKCPGGSLYLSAQSAGPLRVPDDLSVPDETGAFRVPGPVVPPDRQDDEACLQFSPAFSVEEPAEEE